MVLTNIEIDKKYKNIHTNINCIVVSKIFFNIKYYEFKIDPINVYPIYVHYKTFKKHWIEI